MRPREKNLVKAISQERIAILLDEAGACFAKNPKRAKRFCELAFLIVKKNKVRLSAEQKLSFCRKCFSFWRPGRSVSVSFDRVNKRVVYRCLDCGSERRIGYKS
ncbi:MAG: ribonuclease P [Candidatus ainarchaeum sp.]|nr:ribonuclease P [Candidatus ainarchaeum sp.]